MVPSPSTDRGAEVTLPPGHTLQALLAARADGPLAWAAPGLEGPCGWGPLAVVRVEDLAACRLPANASAPLETLVALTPATHRKSTRLKEEKCVVVLSIEPF